jgi:TRAP-type mannitol/chloroaromatic compound transport system substrate-binding protein
MKRRHFLERTAAAGAAGVAALAATSLPKPALAQGVRELRMVTTWPKNFPGLGTSAERLANRITSTSGGKIVVKVFAAGELLPPFESFDAVSGGSVDMYHAAEHYWQGKSRAFNFFAAVPFGMTATEMAAWVEFGGGQALWDKLAAGYNLKPFAVGNTGGQMGGWFNKEINSLEDYKGLNIRMPGLGGAVLRRVGAVAVSLPGSKIFSALQSGAIDATEWVGPWNDLAFGFYKVAKYYYYPGFHEPGTALSCGVNLKIWESMSAQEKSLIQTAMQAENGMVLAEFNARNGEALDVLRNKHKVKVRRFPNPVLGALGQAAGEVVNEAGTADAMTRKIYESFLAFRKKSISWTKHSEQAFWGARLLPFKYG